MSPCVCVLDKVEKIIKLNEWDKKAVFGAQHELGVCPSVYNRAWLVLMALGCNTRFQMQISDKYRERERGEASHMALVAQRLCWRSRAGVAPSRSLNICSARASSSSQTAPVIRQALICILNWQEVMRSSYQWLRQRRCSGCNFTPQRCWNNCLFRLVEL